SLCDWSSDVCSSDLAHDRRSKAATTSGFFRDRLQATFFFTFMMSITYAQINNRELAALRRMFRLGYHETPPKVSRLPKFQPLKENNVRKGFLEDDQYGKLAAATSKLWLRALLEIYHT